jgi:hypothetical protein
MYILRRFLLYLEAWLLRARGEFVSGEGGRYVLERVLICGAS